MSKSEHDRIKDNRRSISRLERALGELELIARRRPVAYVPSQPVAFAPAFLADTPAADDGAPLAASDFVTFEGCDDFYENTTQKTVTVTVTICNDDEDFDMAVDVGGAKKTTVGPGKCKTIIVEIPAGKSLHADRNGRYRV